MNSTQNHLDVDFIIKRFPNWRRVGITERRQFYVEKGIVFIVNKKFVKKCKKIFTKSNAGRKVTVK